MVMPSSTREDSISKVCDAIENSAAQPWMPGLTSLLTTVGYERLRPSMRGDALPYSTGRVLMNRDIAFDVVAQCGLALARQTLQADEGIQVEYGPQTLGMLGESALPSRPRESITPETIAQLDEALTFLNLVTNVWPIVYALVKSLHLIESDDEEIDVSWSTPILPFSVFVSMPKAWSEIAVVRTAESILHETMHLQLTLLQEMVPLVGEERQQYYSPWRRKWRPAESVLQALYVFRVILSFFESVPSDALNLAVRGHLLSRVSTIRKELSDVRKFRDCQELTPIGRRLVDELLTAV